MKKLYYLIIMFVLISKLNAIEISSAYEGKHFLVGFMQNENYIQPSTGLLLQLFITSKYNTNVTISALGAPTLNYFLNKDSIFIVNVDPLFQMTRSEAPFNNSIDITSDLPVTVTVYSSQWKSTDSYAAIPIDKWGTEYVVMSNPNDQYYVPDMIPPEDSLRLASPRSSEFMVIASEDNTEIVFKPRNITVALKQTSTYYKATINKGDCYLVKSYPQQRGAGDLTGTIVKSNKPVGFLSGHVRTAVPLFLNEQWDSKNHLVEMLQPVKSWGRRFVTVPLLPISLYPYGETIKLIGYQPGTNITCRTSGGYKSYFLRDSGDFVVLPNFAEPAVWLSDKPIQIGQYLSHSGYARDSYGFDPAMVSVPPIEQFVQRVLFFTPGNPPNNPFQFSYHFVTLIADQQSLNSLTLDGQLVSNLGPLMTQKITSTNYHYVRLQIPWGEHEIICQNGGFSGILYGVGDADAYAHIIGSSLVNPYIADTIPPTIKLNYSCGNITGYAYEKVDRINSGLDYCQVIMDSTYNFTWNDMTITDTTTYVEILAQVIDITKDGKFVIDIRDKYGNGGRYRFNYNKLNINIPKEINFNDIDARDSICLKFYLYNTGSDTITIKNSYLSSTDKRLNYALGKKLPYKLLPGDSLKCIVCFDPGGDTTELTTDLVFIYDCDLMSRIPLKARILNYDLQTIGHNFGMVRVGDSICNRIGIINHGNSDITIDSLIYDANYKVFQPDTAGIFPHTIKSGDTLFVRVCFMPDSVKDYVLSFAWKNSKISNTHSDVTGNGGAPNIESVRIDWGNRRVGTKNDTTFILRNTGNYKALLKFKQIETLSNEFYRNDIMGINYNLLPGDSVVVMTSYQPDINVPAYLSISLETDWSLHKPILIELFGNGTIPEIKTYDIDFGTVKVNSLKDTIAKFVSSFGNEILLIDSVFLVSKDIGDFSTDLSQFIAVRLDSGTDLSNTFSFNPTKIGYQERIFGVVNDAKPDYLRDTAYFKLMGNAIPNDTLKYDIRLWADGSLINCQSGPINYQIANLGNIPLTIDSIRLIPKGLDVNWKLIPILPVILPVNETLNFDIIGRPFEKTGVNLSVDTRIINKTDTIIDTKKLDLDVATSRIVLNTPATFKSSPGDTVSLTISGVFPIMAEKDISILISGKLEMQSYMITTREPLLILDNNGNQQTIACSLVQTKDSFVITPSQRIILSGDNTSWSITLKLFTFLFDDRHPRIELSVESDRCFDSDNKEITTEIGEVCVINMRAVMASTKSLSVILSPNPVTDQLNTEISVMEKTEAEISVFDELGKKCYYNEKIILNKGKNSRIFEFSSLTNGVYLFNISTPEINKSKIFIILK